MYDSEHKMGIGSPARLGWQWGITKNDGIEILICMCIRCSKLICRVDGELGGIKYNPCT